MFFSITLDKTLASIFLFLPTLSFMPYWLLIWLDSMCVL